MCVVQEYLCFVSARISLHLLELKSCRADVLVKTEQNDYVL